MQYPSAHRSQQVDDFHGTQVADPFRWMEDLDSDETREWIEGENVQTDAYLNAIPQREANNRRPD